MEIDDDERGYCQLLRYCTKIDELEKRKENENERNCNPCSKRRKSVCCCHI